MKVGLREQGEELLAGALVDGFASKFSVAIEDECLGNAFDMEELVDGLIASIRTGGW